MSKFSMKEYENTIYHDAQRYDDEHWWKTDDFPFWKKMLVEASGNKVLELAAGTGRLAIPLIRSSAEYTGIEISPEFVSHANDKLQMENGQGKIILGDIRSFDLSEKFDLIFIGFNSFLHLLTDKDASACLKCVIAHMHDKSRFIIDIFYPSPLFLYRPENMRFPTMEYRDSVTNEKTWVEETNDYNSETGINKIRWFYSTDKNKDIRTYDFTMRMYWPDTMNRLLIDAGLSIKHVWGTYRKTKYSENSNLQIYVAGLK